MPPSSPRPRPPVRPTEHEERAERAELALRNGELYDDTSSPLWRLAVYDAIHEGWEFVNLGGRALLDAFARQAQLGPGTRVLELCSGQAATCRYLAERCQCAVTGVELNRHQVEEARRGLTRSSTAAAARVTLVEADVATWRTRERFDAALCLDSLMLLPQPQEALVTAAALLEEGGLLMAAVITAGPRLDARVRRYVWDNDGMISLLPPEEHVRMLRAAGFGDVQEQDQTELAASASEAMLAAFDRHRDAIIASSNLETHVSSREAAQIYLDAFRERGLVYSVFTGRRARATSQPGWSRPEARAAAAPADAARPA